MSAVPAAALSPMQRPIAVAVQGFMQLYPKLDVQRALLRRKPHEQGVYLEPYFTIGRSLRNREPAIAVSVRKPLYPSNWKLGSRVKNPSAAIYLPSMRLWSLNPTSALYIADEDEAWALPEEVEQFFAAYFAPTCPVEHVSDRAIAAARALLDQMVRRTKGFFHE